MNDRTIYITKFDLERLEQLLEKEMTFDSRDRLDLEELEKELSRGIVVDSKKVPANVVTMNSKVRLLDLDTNKEMVVTLVFPLSADIDRNRISIVSPVGTAILGYSAGDEVEWKVPAGIRRIRIEEILYQPEASGHYSI
ncbi:MAG: nucleoside diphosphate kinase regulator [Desulfobacterales bacterium]|nr:nucleoside diphosphate kinase regulator [Desulfobacterales bacterium]MDD4072514.1 nucleoside diphosphate kinase regulator [Desulfobacterales bacterium]MDD4393709.1 nucleoside diphosphate kinase regulator [Desulfobacterales bacterium]